MPDQFPMGTIFSAEGDDFTYGYIAAPDTAMEQVVAAFVGEIEVLDTALMTPAEIERLGQEVVFAEMRSVLQADREMNEIPLGCEWHTDASGAKVKPCWWIGSSFIFILDEVADRIQRDCPHAGDDIFGYCVMCGKEIAKSATVAQG